MGEDGENPYIATKKTNQVRKNVPAPCFHKTFLQDKKRVFALEELWNRTRALYAFEPSRYKLRD